MRRFALAAVLLLLLQQAAEGACWDDNLQCQNANLGEACVAYEECGQFEGQCRWNPISLSEGYTPCEEASPSPSPGVPCDCPVLVEIKDELTMFRRFFVLGLGIILAMMTLKVFLV